MSPRKAIRYSVSADYQPVGYTWEEGGGGLERGAVRSHERGGDARRLAQACKFGFWSHLGFPGQNAIIFSRNGVF